MGLLDPDAGGQIADRCPNCQRDTSLEHKNTYTMWPRWEQTVSTEYQAFVRIKTFNCMYCHKSTVVRFTYEDSGDTNLYRSPVEAVIISPGQAPRELPPEAPPEAASLYREGSLSEGIGALRGAAALYRATVEALVADSKAKGGNLKDKIDELANQGVDADIVRDLHDTRLTGNWSIHSGVTFTAEEVADVASLIEDAVEILYVLPARRAAMAAARAQRRQGQQP